METIKRKIALFEPSYGGITEGSVALDGCKDYLRITEFVEIEFPKIKQDEIIRGRVAVIDEEMAKLFTKIEDLRQRKQELLALDHLA